MMESIYQHQLWESLQQSKEDGVAESFVFKNEHGEIEYPYIRRIGGEVDGITYYDLVTARGECGPIVRSSNSPDLFGEFNDAFQQYCDQHNIIAEYIRFDPWNTDAQQFAPYYNVVAHGWAYCHSLETDFFMTQYSSKRRNQIRKAINSGIEIKLDEGREKLDQFLELYNYTVNKHGVSRYYLLDKPFLEKYFDLLGDRVSLSFAYYQNKPIAAAMFLNGGDIYHYHFSASHPDYLELNAISYLLFEQAKYGAQAGCKIMDLGGASIGSGLEKFKKSMCRETGIYPCFVGTKIRNQKAYDTLMIQNGSKETGFFPAYRKRG